MIVFKECREVYLIVQPGLTAQGIVLTPNKYRFYWKNETQILKGFCVFLAGLVPIALIILVGVKWDK